MEKEYHIQTQFLCWLTVNPPWAALWLRVQWHCFTLPQHTMWLEKTVLELLILLETGASCVELGAEWIYLWLTTPSSQFVGFPNHLVFMADTFTPLCILYTRLSKCSSLSGFVSVSFSWVRSDPLKHGSPDSIINSQAFLSILGNCWEMKSSF